MQVQKVYFMHYHTKPYTISDSVLLIFVYLFFARIVAVYHEAYDEVPANILDEVKKKIESSDN